MTSQIRLRQHTDGRVAVKRDERGWRIFGEVWHPDGTAFDVSGPGWSELFVAELPEPDYKVDFVKVWDLHTGELTFDESAGLPESPHLHTEGQLRSDALKMLAAVTASERHRSEQGSTTAAPATSPSS